MSCQEQRAEEARPGLRPGRVYQPGASDLSWHIGGPVRPGRL